MKSLHLIDRMYQRDRREISGKERNESQPSSNSQCSPKNFMEH